jgi:hypothetical protein
VVLREPLWRRLRAAQQLDALDIEGIYPLYQQLVRAAPVNSKTLLKPLLNFKDRIDIPVEC